MTREPGAARRDLPRRPQSLFERGYVHGTAGNISVRLRRRLPDHADRRLPRRRSTRRGWPGSTRRRAADAAATAPSKTLALHRAHLRRAGARPARAASSTPTRTHCVALTCAARRRVARRPAAAAHAVLRDEGRPRAADRLPPPRRARGRPSRSARRSRATAARGTPIRAVMLARLGPERLARDAGRGHGRARGAARRRRACWLAAQPPPAPLTPAQIDELRRQLRRPLVTVRGDRHAPLRRQPVACCTPSIAFLDRFDAAAARRLRGGRVPVPLRMRRPTSWPRGCRRNGLQQVLFNAPPGDWDARRARHRLPARARGRVPRRHRAGARVRRRARLPARARDGRPGARGRRRARRAAPTYVEQPALGRGARRPTPGVDVLIEPINTRDIPGFFLNRQDEAHAVLAEIGAPQPQGADGPVPLPDRRGRRGDEDAPVPAHRPRRPPPDRRRARAARARRRRDELPLPVRRDRRRAAAGTAGSAASTGRRAGTSAGLGWLRRERARRGEAPT